MAFCQSGSTTTVIDNQTRPFAAYNLSEGTRMRVNGTLEVRDEDLSEFCIKWKIRELALFGSVLREDFRADSDIDVLVSFEPDEHWDLFDIAEMREELGAIFGRKVDLVDRGAVEQSANPFRKRGILRNTRVVYRRA